MKVQIRQAIETDFPAIIVMLQEFSIFQGTPEKFAITAEQMRADKHLFQCLVAITAKEEIAGFATYFPAYYSWTGKALYLDDLYVKEAFRGKGIGKKILTTIIDEAKTKGCKKVRWQVSKWNSNAIQFYKSIGATIDDVEINCDYLF